MTCISLIIVHCIVSALLALLGPCIFLINTFFKFLQFMFFLESKRHSVSHTSFNTMILQYLIVLMSVLFRFPKLTEQYFEKKPWPDETDVARLVDNDQVS